MPNFDIRSDLQTQMVFNAAISTNTTTDGTIIDTADYDAGIMISAAAQAWTDGSYVIALTESDDSAMSGAVAVADAKLIGTEAGVTLTAAIVDGANLPTIGFFSTLRYVQVSFVSTGTSSGATIVATATKARELLPVT